MSDLEINSSQLSNLRTLTAAEFDAKFPTKRDTWRFINNELRWYLPDEKYVTIWHLKELIRAERTHIKRDAHRTIGIPQYEGLAIKDILAYIQNKPEVMLALPAVESEIKNLPRDYLGNVVITILGDEFQQWVDDRVLERNTKRKEEGEMNIELDPEVEAAFRASTSVGSTSNNLSLCLNLDFNRIIFSF
ncbi:MAG: hypothetical protein NZ730_06480 [Porticoccaceae bacterium]|nr:hypothetical protein [Porticoccaceae bacterium]